MTLPIERHSVFESYRIAQSRILFLDYDGTLVPLIDIPERSELAAKTRDTIQLLSSDPGNQVYIISGRDRSFLLSQFNGTGTGLIAEHGLWLKKNHGRWIRTVPVDTRWKKQVGELLRAFSLKYPGTFIETKENSVVFHFRTSEKSFENRERKIFRELFTALQRKHPGIELLEGNHILEVKPAGYNKGTAAEKIIRSGKFDFILAAGDDFTDENLFSGLPEGAFTIKIGMSESSALFRTADQGEFIRFMRQLTAIR
jgi:trehalose 6-phosphate synthase/phosphatase